MAISPNSLNGNLNLSINLIRAVEIYGYTKTSEVIQTAYNADIIHTSDAVEAMDFLAKLWEMDFCSKPAPEKFQLR